MSKQEFLDAISAKRAACDRSASTEDLNTWSAYGNMLYCARKAADVPALIAALLFMSKQTNPVMSKSENARIQALHTSMIECLK